MNKDTDNIVIRICEYMSIYKLINAMKFIIYVLLMLYVMDILVKYYDKSIHIMHIDMVYIILMLLMVMLYETVYEFSRNIALNKLVNKYQSTNNVSDKHKLYYLIIGYISIHKSFMLHRLRKEYGYAL